MKKLVILMFIVFPCVTINAEKVTAEQAREKAQRFMPGKIFVQGSSVSYAKARGLNQTDAFYLFNAEGGDGFVIVSGDSRTAEILAYSNHGSLNVDNLPENLKWWLNSYTEQMAALDITPIPSLGTSYKLQAPPIAPLIKSNWGQIEPYNYMCPDGNYTDYDEDDYNADRRCVTGCVATAMAQIMNYWQWPKTCPALDSYTEINGHTIKGLPSTTFKWELMKDTYDVNETGESANAVAELMRYCGQAVQMRYSPGASAAWLFHETLISTFQYSPNCNLLNRDCYSTRQWESIIYEELAAQRPVQYCGSSLSYSSHAFIIDGYDGNGLFHINWGWEGYQDSYFVLSLADSGYSNVAYQSEQYAYVGVQPATQDEVVLPAMYGDIFKADYPTSQMYNRLSPTENFTDVSLVGFFSSKYNIEPHSTLSAEIGWGLFQDDVLLTPLASQPVTVPAEKYESWANELTVSFGADLSEGIYQLDQIYRFTGETEWHRSSHHNHSIVGMSILLAEVTPTSMTIRLPNDESMSFDVNSINTSEYPAVGKELNVTANITNTSDVNLLTINLWSQKQGESSWKKVAAASCYQDPGMSSEFFLSYVPEEAGTFNMKLTAGNDEEAMKTFVLQIAHTENVVIDGITYSCNPEYKRAVIVNSYYEDNSISEVTLQSKVTVGDTECQLVEIGAYAFDFYSKIETLVIPEGVETIGDCAFAYMYGMKTLSLPSTLKKIGENVIYQDSGLETILLKAATPPAIADSTFATLLWNGWKQQYSLTPATTTLYVPMGTKSQYEAIAGWTQFKKIEEGEPMETMVNGFRYSYATGGTTATIIADDSYKEMKEITIPSSVTISGKKYKVAVGKKAFYCCDMETLTIEEGVEAIGAQAFDLCCLIQTLVVPEGVETIDDAAFAGMFELKKLSLPSTLKEIGACVIDGNKRLETVVSKAMNPCIIDEKAFVSRDWNNDTQKYEYSPSPATLYVPIGAKSQNEAISGWTQFAKIEESEQASTDICTPHDEESIFDNAWYSLQGVKVVNPQKGIFIRNGRKVVLQ